MPKEQSGTMLKKLFLVAGMMAAVPALSCLAQSKPVVIEEVIARVNNDAIYARRPGACAQPVAAGSAAGLPQVHAG